jgi:gluconate 2-dehydrogenase gamma chain
LPADPAGLSAAEVAVLVAVADRIVPDEDGSPGAVRAGADRYIRRSLAAERAGLLAVYQAGLAEVDAAATALFGHGFAGLAAGQQDEVLASAWPGPAGAFLTLVRAHVIEGMFGDPRWGGNEGLAGWALFRYPGPQRVWTAAEQAVTGPGGVRW